MTGMSHISQLVVRWLARGISTLAALLWLLIFLDIVACDALVGVVCVNWEMLLLLAIALVSVATVILAWTHEGFGGFVMLIYGIAFTIFAVVDSRTLRMTSILISGIPFLVAGSLFLLSWRLSKNLDEHQPAMENT